MVGFPVNCCIPRRFAYLRSPSRPKGRRPARQRLLSKLGSPHTAFCEAVSTVDETLVPNPKRAGFYAMAIGFDLYPFNHILGVRCHFNQN